MLQYQGPDTITKSLSNNNTSFAIQYNNQTYYRNIMYNKYMSTKNPPVNVQMYIDNSHNVGSYVTVIDRLSDNHYNLSKILTVDEHTTTVHHMPPTTHVSVQPPLYQDKTSSYEEAGNLSLIHI